MLNFEFISWFHWVFTQCLQHFTDANDKISGSQCAIYYTKPFLHLTTHKDCWLLSRYIRKIWFWGSISTFVLLSIPINSIALVDNFISKFPLHKYVHQLLFASLFKSFFFFLQLHVRCPKKQKAKTKYTADCPSNDLFVAYRNNSITISSKSPCRAIITCPCVFYSHMGSPAR